MGSAGSMRACSMRARICSWTAGRFRTFHADWLGFLGLYPASTAARGGVASVRDESVDHFVFAPGESGLTGFGINFASRHYRYNLHYLSICDRRYYLPAAEIQYSSNRPIVSSYSDH